MEFVSLAGRVLLTTVLLTSGAGKLTPRGIAAATEMFRQLSLSRGARTLAATLGVVELVVAVAMVVPGTAVLGTAAAAVVLATMTAGVAVILVRRADVRCACFGARTTRLRPVHLVRNSAMVVVATVALPATVSAGAPTATPDEVVLAAVLGVLVAFLLIRLDDLAVALSPRVFPS